MKGMSDEFGMILKIWHNGKEIIFSAEDWEKLPAFLYPSYKRINSFWTVGKWGSVVWTAEGFFKSKLSSDQLLRHMVSPRMFYSIQYGLNAMLGVSGKRKYLKVYCDCDFCMQTLNSIRSHPVWINIANIYGKSPEASRQHTLLNFGQGCNMVLDFDFDRFEKLYTFDAGIFKICRCDTFGKFENAPQSGILPIGRRLPPILEDAFQKAQRLFEPSWEAVVQVGLLNYQAQRMQILETRRGWRH